MWQAAPQTALSCGAKLAPIWETHSHGACFSLVQSHCLYPKMLSEVCVSRHTHPRTHLCVSLPKPSAWSLLNPWGLLRAWACRRALTESLEISLLALCKVTLFIKNISLHLLHFIYFHILVHRYIGINKKTWDKLRLKKWRPHTPSLTGGRGSSMPLFGHFGEKISEETTGGGTGLGYATCGTLPGLTRMVSN